MTSPHPAVSPAIYPALAALLALYPTCTPAQIATQTTAQITSQTTPAASPSSLSGTVLDKSGALVPNAHVTLKLYAPVSDSAVRITFPSLPPGPYTTVIASDGTVTILDKTGAAVRNARTPLKLDFTSRETTSDSAGRFTFTDVPAGPYNISISAEGLVTLTTSGTIRPSTDEQLPQLILPLATVDTAVEVTASTHDIAEAEIHVEEHQRLFGAIPNFYVTYDWHAAPLSSGQKFQLTWKTVLDPVNIGINAGIAGVEQAANSYPGFGTNTASYFKRFGAANGDVLFGTFLGGYLFPVIFHQDPRYFYLGKGTILHRTLYALSTAVIARGDNGKWQPGYAAILGDLSAGAISNFYYPASSRQGATLTFENGLLSIAADGVSNVIQEFLLRHLTRNPPPYTPPTP